MENDEKVRAMLIGMQIGVAIADGLSVPDSCNGAITVEMNVRAMALRNPNIANARRILVAKLYELADSIDVVPTLAPAVST